MATGMNLQRLMVALLLSLLASLCYAQEKGEPSGAKKAGEKADAQSQPPADGALLYKQYCQACHMADGKGAIGAGTYPALANNPKLQAASYPVIMVLYGKAGMPWFNGLLTPEQIAAIVGYVRTNFGNNYAEPVTTEEVAKMRGPVPTDE
ncbi:MAG: cytochrome c [Planctomycetota bacterium]